MLKMNKKYLGMFLLLCCMTIFSSENLLTNAPGSDVPMSGMKTIHRKQDDGKCLQVVSYGKVLNSDLIEIDPEATYELSGSFCQDNQSGKINFGLIYYDQNKTLIPHSSMSAVNDTNAVLAESVQKGAKLMKFKDAKNWGAAVKGNSKIIAMDVKEDLSDLPNRNLCCFVTKMTRNGDLLEVELSHPAPGAYPARTLCRLHRDGGYNYCLLKNQSVPETWKEYKTEIAGTALSGVPTNHFWKTTKYVKVCLYCSEATVWVKDLSFRKVKKAPEGAILAETCLQPVKDGDLIACGTSVFPRRAYTQNQDGSLVLEAESPWDMGSSKPDTTSILLNPDCSGGAYAVHVKNALYLFTVEKAGTYDIYYRQKLPFAGDWNHTEIWDGKPEKVQDSREGDGNYIGKWRWHKTGKRTLSAGEHTLAIDFQGGAMVDQIALVPENKLPPTNMSMPVHYTAEGLRGERVFGGYLSGKNKSNATLTYQIPQNSGAVSVALSLDNGKHWTPAQPDIKIPGDEKEMPLLVKVSMHSENASKIPLIENLAVKYYISTELPPEKSHIDKTMEENLSHVVLLPVKWKGVRWNPEQKLCYSKPLVQDNNGKIVMAVADADQITLAPQDRTWMENDELLKGMKTVYQGRFNRNIISFDFDLKESGVYRPYFLVRMKLPSAKIVMDFNRSELVGLQYVYSVDNNFFRINYSGNGIPFQSSEYCAGKYYWAAGDPSELMAGEHTFRFRRGFYYMSLAAIAILPENGASVAKPEIALHSSSRKNTQNAVVEYGRLKGKLQKIVCSDKNSTARFDISYDGKTFGPLPMLPMKNTTEFILRGHFSGTGEIPEVTAEIDPVRVMMLSDNSQKLLFDQKTGNLFGYYLADGTSIIPAGISKPLYSFEVGSKKAGYRVVAPGAGNLQEQSCRKEHGKQILELRYSTGHDTIRTLVRVTLENNCLPQWELKIENASDEDIRNIEFPIFPDVRLGADPEKVRATIIQNIGAFDYPGAPLGFDFGSGGTWPGSYSMGYAAIHVKGTGSFTVQNRNPDAYGVRFAQNPNPGRSALYFSANRRYCIEPGKSAVLRYDAGFYPGDEHEVCNLYGQWAHTWMDFSLVNGPLTKYATGANHECIYPPGRTENQMIPINRWMGYDMHWFLDCFISWTHLFRPMYGTPEELRAIHAALLKAGQPAYYYWDHYGWSEDWTTKPTILGYKREELADINSLLPPGTADRAGARSERGNLLPWNYVVEANHGTSDNKMCTDNDYWCDYMVRIMTDYFIGKYGASGVYSDESCLYTECFNTAHRHGKQYGSKMVGLGKTYKRILEKVKGMPFILSGEGSPDYLLQFEDFGLRSGHDAWDGSPLLFAFPEVKFFRGLANHPWDGVPNWDEALRDYHLQARSDAPPFSGNVRHFFEHRKRIGDWMYNGTFRDDVGLHASRPGIQAKYFLRNTKDHSGLLINARNEFLYENEELILARSIVPPSMELPDTALAYLMEEEYAVPLAIKKGKQSFSVAVPVSKASSILIPFRLPEEEQVRICFTWPQCKGKDLFRISFMNFGKKNVSFPVELVLPKEIETDAYPRHISLKSGEYRELRITFNGREKLGSQAYAQLKTGMKEQSVLLSPALGNRSFEAHPDKEPVPDLWGTNPAYYVHAFAQNKDKKLNLRTISGVLDDHDPFDGKYSLRLPGHTIPLPFPVALAGPYGRSGYPLQKISLPWYYNAQQNAVLKPDTRYRLKFACRFASDNGVLKIQGYPYVERSNQVSFTFPEKTFRPATGNRGWNKYQIEFKTPDRILNASMTPVTFVNLADTDLWLDAVELTEIGEK